jgi:hypothetical protein
MIFTFWLSEIWIQAFTVVAIFKPTVDALKHNVKILILQRNAKNAKERSAAKNHVIRSARQHVVYAKNYKSFITLFYNIFKAFFEETVKCYILCQNEVKKIKKSFRLQFVGAHDLSVFPKISIKIRNE